MVLQQMSCLLPFERTRDQASKVLRRYSVVAMSYRSIVMLEDPENPRLEEKYERCATRRVM